MIRPGSLRVEKAGPLALLQDGGRFGVRHLGITQGGPLDHHASHWANALLDNPATAPVLEIALGGLTLVAENDTSLALCGADLGARCNSEAIAPWQRFTVKAGDRLSFDWPQSGVRAYLAAPGGWQGQMDLGSVACVMREGLGGHKGQGLAIASGDQMRFGGSETIEMPAMDTVPLAQQVDYKRPAVLELIAGGQIANFDGRSLYNAFNREWAVAERADRMGIRLTGPVLTCQQQAMISEGIAPGSVQVPPDGQPIALLNDRQTIGGYPRLGTLSPMSCARLAQCPTGHPVFLRPVTVGAVRQHWQAALDAITAR
jgi:biotin-dependent carboxylase-like uncharacterized protein